ncbi:MAG: folate family ECF transporter S component [Lachnospiraceae bacterium]|nr:folate family ECF transporter S component [Lachnospiraceae bacterium]
MENKGGTSFRNVRVITVMGMLVALEIVLSRFLSFNVWNMKIGFAFVPVVAAAFWYGPLHAGIVGALADFLGAVLFPIGPYFPGFTLTAFLIGAVFGLFLHRKQDPLRALCAVGINQLVLSLLLNTLWISILYGSKFVPLLGTRLAQCAILAPVQFVFILAAAPLLTRAAVRKAVS